MIYKKLLGLQPYREIWDIQKLYNKEVKEGKRPDTVIFLEHEPVFTLGRHGNIANFHLNELKNACGKVELVHIERGGDITFHGPGQLVVYFIVDLIKRGYGIKQFVDNIEEIVIKLCSEFDIEGLRRPNAPGVWIYDDSGYRKICALGLKVTHGVTMHGLALNVTTDLSWFNFINPCGFNPGSVTSIEKEIKNTSVPAIETIIETLKKYIEQII